MAKATFKLPNGTIVNIDGSPDEIHQLLVLYRGSTRPTVEKETQRTAERRQKQSQKAITKAPVDHITQIVNLIKECNEAASIEENILDRTSVVNRVLLPLYIVHEYMNNDIWLQSGDISKITKELGVHIFQPNVSRTLTETASRYVTADRTRKGKRVIKYKLNRRGVNYLKGVLQGQKA